MHMLLDNTGCWSLLVKISDVLYLSSQSTLFLQSCICAVNECEFRSEARLALTQTSEFGRRFSELNSMFWTSLISPSSKCLQKSLPTTVGIGSCSRRSIRLPAPLIDNRGTLNPWRTPFQYAIPSGCARRSQPLVPCHHSYNPLHLVRNCYTHSRMAGPVPEASKSADQYRLPTNVKPVHYDLTVRTDLQKLRFDGYVTAQYVAAIQTQ